MKKDIFAPADILLPEGISHETWSVVACDQFSSEPLYWENVRKIVGPEPSTLNMVIPEAYLDEIDIDKESDSIRASMDRYISSGLFRKIEDSFVYVERALSDGRVRRGLVGTINLDEYDFSGSDAAILASEGTVLDRLPPRIRVRRGAPLELPHIIAFIDDMENTVIEPLSAKAGSLPTLYDFSLMEGGGHIKGMHVSGTDAIAVTEAMRALHMKSGTLMVIGDGNHSLAAAKVFWDEIKKSLSAAERATHPAGKALIEVNNVYDPSISFEAIHRAVFDVDSTEFLRAISDAVPLGNDYELRWHCGKQSGVIGVAAGCIGDMLAAVQSFLDNYVIGTGCSIDYIHGEDALIKLTEDARSLGLLLPAMDKSELFATVTSSGVFPRKSFSVGHARDKRYYLECRRIAF